MLIRDAGNIILTERISLKIPRYCTSDRLRTRSELLNSSSLGFVPRQHMSNNSRQSVPSRSSSLQSQDDQHICQRDITTRPSKQVYPTSLLSWWRLWLVAVHAGMRAPTRAKWLKRLELVRVGFLAVARRDRVREVSTYLTLVHLTCGDRNPRFIQSTPCPEALKETVSTANRNEFAPSKAYDKMVFTWDAELFKCRKFQDREYFSIKESLNVDRDDLDYFLELYPGSKPSWKVECIKNFCSKPIGSYLKAELSSESTNNLPVHAWLDSRICKKGSLEVTTGMFCPSELHDILKKGVGQKLLTAPTQADHLALRKLSEY